MGDRSLHNRIAGGQLVDRLDSEYYTKDLLANEQKLSQFNENRLCDLVDESKPNNIADLSSNGSFEFLRGILFNEKNGIPFIRTQNLMDGYVDDNVIYVNQECNLMVTKSICETGDLIVCRKGKVGAASSLPEKMNGAAISENVTRFSLKAEDDGDFFAAFLNSFQGRKRFLREATGVIQKWINNEKLREIKIIRLNSSTEKYIGDKVRQAERLRAWANGLKKILDESMARYQPIQKSSSSLSSMISPELLTNMLTATTYRDHYVKNQKNLLKQWKTDSVLDFFASVANGFDERTELKDGLPYVKVADVMPDYIDLRRAPKVRQSALKDAGAKQIPKIGDLLLTRKGSFGIAAVVMESDEFLCSSEVFSCKPKKQEYMPILAYFLNSTAGNMQFWQFSTGSIMPSINQDNLYNIQIPDFSGVNLEEFNRIYKLRFNAKKLSELLTTAAKFLVEALIEGQLDENQLIAAQALLQTGDDSADRSILKRLKTDGVDGAGQPLFADLDELYRLLALAKED